MKACFQIASATYFLRKDIKKIPISADYLRVLVFLFNTESSARRDKQGL